jgi:tagatose-1,6-bisphosphate aldolase
MPYLLGTRRGLEACASARGTFAVLALDHRQNLRRELHPDAPGATSYAEMVDFKRAVVRALAGTATGTLLDPEIGAAQCIADGSLPATAGLLVAIEATGYEGPATARASRILQGWSVEQAKRIGASAAKLLVYYHPDAANAADQERLVAEVATACRDADLALFIEPLGFDPATGGMLAGEARRRCVVETARRLMAIGGDVLKAEFPYDPAVTDEVAWADACTELDAVSPVPWVLLSGGVDDATFERQVAVACRAGASASSSALGLGASATMPGPIATPGWPGWARLSASSTRRRGRRAVHARPGTLVAAELPDEGWYREY